MVTFMFVAPQGTWMEVTCLQETLSDLMKKELKGVTLKFITEKPKWLS